MINHEKAHTADTKFHGNYRAVVVDNEDPLQAGRVKIRVPSIHDDSILDEQLPWAIYADPMMGGAEDLGGFFIPDEGSRVWIFFENGEHDQPVYFAGAPMKPDLPVEKTKGTYPRNKVFKTKSGFVFEIDDTEETTRLRILQPSGNEKESDHDGNVIELIKGDRDETVEGNQSTSVGGNEDLSVVGNITISADGVIQMTTGSTFSVSNGSEELVNLLSELVQEIVNITTNTVYGPTPTNNKAQFSALKTRIDTFKE